MVATNALELGIDIGSLDVSVMAGYPGTIASTWQRAGRAGRRTGASCAVLVASSLPLDQFIINHPDYFFGSPPEHAFIQPDNLEILVNHLKAAAFELPLASGERFGDMDLSPIYEHLVEAGFLHRSGEFWHWTNESYPADAISLRAVTSDNFVIIDETETPRVIGEVDFSSALSSVHPKAIYIHEGQQYHVERLDFEQRKAYVRRVRVDHFTQAVRYTEVRVLELAAASGLPGPAMKAHGDVLVRSRVVGFKKIKFFTLENIGSGKLDLPENEMHTTAFWLTLRHSLLGSLPFSRSERQAGLFGLLYALETIATLLLMCDRRDLDSTIGESAPPIATGAAPQSSEAREPSGEFFEPNLYLYDAYPGGIGFSEPLFAMHELLMGKARDLIAACACERGCPSCVGPAGRSARARQGSCTRYPESLVVGCSHYAINFSVWLRCAPLLPQFVSAPADPRCIPSGSPGWSPAPAEATTLASTCSCAASLATLPSASLEFARSVCWFPMLEKRLWNSTGGSFLTSRPRACPAAAAPTRSWSAWPGGKTALSSWNSFSCAIIARRLRFCSRFLNGCASGASWLHLTERVSIGL